MAGLNHIDAKSAASVSLLDLCARYWSDRVTVTLSQEARICRLTCGLKELLPICQWLTQDLDLAFATLIVEEEESGWLLHYVFYGDADPPLVSVELELDAQTTALPSISSLAHGPSADWHEREAEDLFGLTFEGHPRLGEFVLHEDWPEGINPMRRSFDARRIEGQELEAAWKPPTIVAAPGAFAMPIGPVFSDFAESAHFLLETVGEDVIHTIPRFFYKYRGVEKIAEGRTANRALLLAERFSGASAFAHGLAFCQCVETIRGIEVPPRARVLRTVFAELERLRSHAATIAGICNSTALAIATSQAALIEEDLLRLSCEVTQHRYLFGLVKPGGLSCDLSGESGAALASRAGDVARGLDELHQMLRYSSSFLDRLEEVGVVSAVQARTYGLVGPIARASGLESDVRKLLPYAAYASSRFAVPVEAEGDGYARLRIFFREAEQSVALMRQLLVALPEGPICADPPAARAGEALSAVEAPSGAAFHWLRLDDEGTVVRYRITPPSFTNWHAFPLAAENFAFQDFPIILASFGLSNAECDR